MRAAFRKAFGYEPAAIAEAPGRVNLMGDHTDYADGFCLPMPLRHVIEVAIAPAQHFSAVSLSNGERQAFDPAGPARGDWTDYIAGSLAALAAHRIDLQPISVLVRSAVPQGAGVSSSAALEVAVIRAFLKLQGIAMPDAEVARAAQAAENSYCGVQCGILDQMAVAVGRAGEALLLDCQSNETRSVSIPAGFRFAVVHCGKERRLVDGVYNERRISVENAARTLGVSALRNATPDMLMHLADETMHKRARHVVSENARVLAAVEAISRGDAAAFGTLMVESHHSLAVDFEVSVPALDRLVASALAAGAYGARLTGAGFGGCIVALLAAGDPQAWWGDVLADNPDAWLVQI